jgi:hypothetical protein
VNFLVLLRQIFYVITAHDRNFFRLLPQVLGRSIRVGRCYRQIHRESVLAQFFKKSFFFQFIDQTFVDKLLDVDVTLGFTVAVTHQL